MNYTPPPPFPSETHIARVATWLTLTVVWFAAHVLALIAPDEAKRYLATFARWANTVIIAKALRRRRDPKTQPRRPYPCGRQRRITLRVIGGGALRSALQSRSAAGRAGAIYAILTKPERWIARVMRRIARRFTKLRTLPRPILAIAFAPTPAPCAPQPLNSS